MVGYRAEDETVELDFEERRRGDRNSEDCLPISLTGFSGWCEVFGFFFFSLNFAFLYSLSFYGDIFE